MHKKSYVVVPASSYYDIIIRMGRTKLISNDYIIGLTDGEGCFYVNKSNLKSYTSGVRIQLHFHLKLRGM